MKTTATLLIIALGSAALSSCHHKKAATEAEDPQAVAVAEIVTDSVTIYKDYPGTLQANRTVAVVCRTNGTLSQPLYQGGDLVKQGQLLFTIDSSTAHDDVLQAEAALATARSENAYAEEHYAAVSRALESGAVSKMEVSQAKSARDQSVAAIKNAQAALASARTRLGYCRITAPLSGHITTNQISGGSYISGEAEPVTLATIYEDNVLIAHFAIEDDAFQEMFLNKHNPVGVDMSKIPLQFADSLLHSYTADLSYLAPNVDPSTGTMNIEAKIKNTYNELKAGMYLTLHMPYKREPHAMLVRDASVGSDQLGNYIYVVNDSNRVVYTPIKTGDVVADTMRVVLSGVKPGTRYVTSALLKVRDGMTVKPVSTAPTPKK